MTKLHIFIYLAEFSDYHLLLAPHFPTDLTKNKKL